VRSHLAAALPAITRFALVLTRSRSDSDDLVQMTCERALCRSAQWQPDTRLESWLFRIMHSIWINELRYRRVRDSHRTNPDPIITVRDGEQDSETKLELRRVEDRVLRLPETERLVLLLVCVQGFTYRETAEVLSIPIGTVMSRLARARLHLSESLESRTEARTSDTEAANIHRLRR
jgi:RNA polymerase sigma-70 factor, ECF subfamily